MNVEPAAFRPKELALLGGLLEGGAARDGGLLAALRRHAIAAWAACGAFEWVAFIYLALSSFLVGLFAENLRHLVRLLALQGFVAITILTLGLVQARSALRAQVVGKRWTTLFWHFWRHWYPHLFFLFCFEELGQLVHLVDSRWEDAKVIAFDHWLAGVHPAVWLEQFATPARNDFFQFAYFTYFTYLLIVGGILYYRGERRAYWSVMTYSMVGYAIGYLIAIFFPIESPWFAMAGFWRGDLHGGAFTGLMSFIERLGRVRGAAFPSEHVAGSIAALWGAWRHRRWLFWVLLPLVTCMCASTIWGRYHYVADVLAGLVTGTLGYWLGSKIMRHRRAVTGEPASPASQLLSSSLAVVPVLRTSARIAARSAAAAPRLQQHRSVADQSAVLPMCGRKE